MIWVLQSKWVWQVGIAKVAPSFVSKSIIPIPLFIASYQWPAANCTNDISTNNKYLLKHSQCSMENATPTTLDGKRYTYPNFVPLPNDAKNFEAKHSPAEIPWLLHSTTQDQIHEQQWAPPGPALPLVTALGRGRQWRWKNLTDVVGDQKRQHVSIDMFRNLKWYCWQWSKLAKRVDRNTDILNFTNCKVFVHLWWRISTINKHVA